ncbi:hypothetical protein [Streptomyces bluensis]|uniref:hypothetical protein n=1 Tax=Streptomyces bluensis TaxID=33897 RepID=UPI001675CE60|nr:hypothetical protein [Streptomyces bluensis]GGZ78956.1 hypothetical protein GCM10010344_52470 [Streptomyces bluensis]
MTTSLSSSVASPSSRAMALLMARWASLGASPALIGHLQLLLGEELGADEDELVMRQFRKAYSQPCGWRGLRVRVRRP